MYSHLVVQEQRYRSFKRWVSALVDRRQYQLEQHRRVLASAFSTLAVFAVKKRRLMRWQYGRAGVLLRATQHHIKKRLQHWHCATSKRKVARYNGAALQKLMGHQIKRRVFSGVKISWVRRELARRKEAQTAIEMASIRLENEFAQYRAQNTEHEALQVTTLELFERFCLR